MNKSFILILLFLFIEACQPKVSCEPCPVCLKCPSCENAEKSLDHKDAPEVENNKKAIDQNAYNWFVIHVTDGDTLVVKQELEFYPDRRETIRLLNINTPERGMPLYGEATTALKELVRTGDVTLEYEKPDLETRGHYGRLLAYVICEGKNINIEMVRLGFSSYWTKYGKSRYDKEFKKAEEEARQNHLGMWKDSL